MKNIIALLTSLLIIKVAAAQVLSLQHSYFIRVIPFMEQRTLPILLLPMLQE